MKIRKFISTVLACMGACAMCTACGAEPRVNKIAEYHGQNTDPVTGKMTINEALFYRNDKKTDGADPFVLDNTSRDGYYYAYTTHDYIYCFRSKDLMYWEPVGNTLQPEIGSEAARVLYKDRWAAEVVYDDGTYYMFFSATPMPDPRYPAGNGIGAGEKNGTTAPTAFANLMVGVSSTPFGPYTLVDFTDEASCGAGNTHVYNTELGKEAKEGEAADENGFRPAFPQYYSKYHFLNPSWYFDLVVAEGMGLNRGYGSYQCAIDAHPFVDKDGRKYLFWSKVVGDHNIIAMEMESWLKPKWETVKVISRVHYYTVADWRNNSAEQCAYDTTEVNEGTTVIEHNGKYYLTYSTGSYETQTYQVIQAVADSVMGDYRKLTEEEGAIVISTITTGSEEVTGPGHHCFVKVGDYLYIVYHRHDSVVIMGGARNLAIDEVKWITVKDKFGNDLEVMYVNGPTATLQPALEPFSEYKNIAPQARVTGPDAQYLTDGLLSVQKMGDPTFNEYIKETVIREKTTFRFEFDEPRTVRAIMAYQSKNEWQVFESIERIKMEYVRNGKTYIGVIDDLPLNERFYEKVEIGSTKELAYVSPGAAIFTEFDELTVKSIEITIDVPSSQREDGVAISEIRILGK